MIKILIYVLLFALSTMIVYAWGIIKSQNKQKDLLDILYVKGEKRVIKELKKNNNMTKIQLQNSLKDLKASLFYSRNKIIVTDPKVFTTTLLRSMEEKGIIKCNNGKYNINN